MMLVEKAEEIAAFCDATEDSVGLLLDTGHATAAGADYAEIIRRFGSTSCTFISKMCVDMSSSEFLKVMPASTPE